jgi:site-specific recombinase XerD
MIRPTFTILFYIKRTKKLKNGNSPIYVRLTINQQRAEFSIKKSINPDNWEIKNGGALGSSKKAKEINSYLEVVSRKLQNYRTDLEDRGNEVTPLTIKNAYLGIGEEQKTILGIFKKHNERCNKLINIDFAPGTVERYETCYLHTERFISYMYKKKDMVLNDITPEFIRDYEYYLKTERNCAHNTTIKYLRNFKKIIRIAFTNGWMKHDPFTNIKYQLKDVDIDFLTEEELNTLIKKPLTINRLQQVKDVYLFCCFTGLAFVDIKNLTYDEIVDVKGKSWIKKKRQKTKNWCNIPLIEPANQLLQKYKDHPLCQTKGIAFPVPSNQKMNAYLKEIADLCGINKNLRSCK